MNEKKNIQLSAADFEFVPMEGREHDKKLESKPVGYFRDAFNRFCRNKASVVAAIIIVVLLLYAIFVPVFCENNYTRALTDTMYLNYGKLPPNFITKSEAQKLGWDSSRNYVGDVAPGKSIGGDRFGNYEGLLPEKSGRTWKEADVNYVSGPRGAERIVFSNDGLVYYTGDHYESFTQMHPSK